MKTGRRINLNAVMLGLLVAGVAVLEGHHPHADAHESSFVSQAPNVRVHATTKAVEDFSAVEADLQAYMKLEQNSAHDPAQLARKREKLLKNASLLRSLRGFLSRPALDAREAAEQNTGFALLLQAAHGDQGELATETLRLVVADEEMDEILNDNTEPHRRVQSIEPSESDDFSPRSLGQKMLEPSPEKSSDAAKTVF